MKTRGEALAYGLSFPDTYQEAPFHDDNWQLIRVKGSKKAFLWVYEKDGIIQLNVKANPEWRDYWRDAFASVIPGYHQNKEHWNTILLDGTVPDDAVRTMIAESYDIITDSPTKRIYEAVKQIPRGKVATYGQIAALAGEPKMARAVGNALHKNTDPEHIPCYRVVNSKGELAAEFVFGGAGKQADMLEADGIVLGCLTPDGEVDIPLMKQLMEAAQGMSVTFHRAFDVCCNPQKALEEIISLGCDRILTSGQQPTAELGIPLLKELQQQAAGRITLLAGCGVNETNIAHIANETGIHEFHFSARETIASRMQYRKEQVPMGSTVQINEFERNVTTKERVKATIAAILS